jgi:hypothetical protein
LELVGGKIVAGFEKGDGGFYGFGFHVLGFPETRSIGQIGSGTSPYPLESDKRFELSREV